MKAKLFVIGLFLLAFVACTSRAKVAEHGQSEEGPNPELSAIDSLMWRQPDSALAVLQQFAASSEADSLDELNGHYCQLLISELLYKNDYGQSNRPALQQAVAYFDSLILTLKDTPTLKRLIAGTDPLSLTRNDNIHFLTARAHYINGVGYYERDSVVEACKEYLKALEVMEGRFDEKEMVGKKAQFMALTHTRLTILFSDLYLHEQTICFGLLSLGYYKKFASPHWHIAWMLNKVGSQYDMMDNNDSAKMLYMNALQILPDTNNITYRDIATRLAYLSYKMGESPEKSLKQLHTIIAQAENEKEFYSRCMNIGEIFYHESQFDSAAFYLSKVFHESQNVNSKKQVAEWLVEICKTQGKEIDMIEYADFLVPFANVEENQSAIKSQLTELYKNYAQREQERVFLQERMKNKKMLKVILGVFFVLMASFIILYFNGKRKNQQLETKIETERQSHTIQQKALLGKLKKRNKALQDALQQLGGNFVPNEIQNKPKNDYISFIETPICRHILESVHQQKFKSKIDFISYKEYALQKEHIIALRMAADENLDNFTVRLRKCFQGLTDEDVTYCCFYLLDLTDADIAALMQKAYPTVCERKRKIKRIIGGENNLAFTLRSFTW